MPPIVERAAVDELAHDVLPSVVLADVVDRDDVRMIERRRDLRFSLETASRGRVGEILAEEFDGDGTVQLRVDRAVDVTHPTGAEE